MGEYERTIPSVLPGCWRRHADKGDQTQHGKPQRGLQFPSTGDSRESGRAVWGGGEARSTDEAG
jgi:hypothetical protein